MSANANANVKGSHNDNELTVEQKARWLRRNLRHLRGRWSVVMEEEEDYLVASRLPIFAGDVRVEGSGENLSLRYRGPKSPAACLPIGPEEASFLLRRGEPNAKAVDNIYRVFKVAGLVRFVGRR